MKKNTKKYILWEKKNLAKFFIPEKIEIENLCQPLIERFKKIHINKNPGKEYNYLIDIYIKWRGNYIYFLAKYRTGKNAMVEQEFDEGFVRLEYVKNDSFNLSYFRHTGKWFTVANSLSLKNCLEMIEQIPTFHPIP
ncbi:MAG TPA: hypothetical protein VFI29_14475 [Hanamia sp.]|nr:hypothetical protein [Hanamia sp.]